MLFAAATSEVTTFWQDRNVHVKLLLCCIRAVARCGLLL